MFNLGAGADSVYGGEIISNSTISGGAGQDTFLISTLSNAASFTVAPMLSVSITGSLYGATVDFGAGNESFTLTVGATNSTIAGGAGNDTFVGNVPNCRLPPRLMVVPVTTRFPSVVSLSGGSIAGGAGNDTLNFSAGVNNGAFVSGDAGSDLLLFSSTISGSRIYGGRRWRQHGLQGCYFQQHD